MMPGNGAFRHWGRVQPCTGAIIVGMVRKERLELSRVAPLEPKSSASTNSATLANFVFKKRGVIVYLFSSEVKRKLSYELTH